MTEEEIGIIFGEAVEAYKKLPSSITVAAAILSLTGCKVIPTDQNSSDDRKLIESLAQAADHCMRSLQDDPIKSRRVNEVGNLFEPRLKTSCKEVGLKAEWPAGGRSGYPDLLIFDHEGRPTYIEIKTVGPGQEHTTFRSFYLSPSEKPKITMDARHILIAFSHKAGPVVNEITEYSAISFKIVDLAAVCGNIKFEYQSSNKRMYDAPQIIAQGAV